MERKARAGTAPTGGEPAKQQDRPRPQSSKRLAPTPGPNRVRLARVSRERPAAVDRLAAMLLEKESRAAEVARLLHDHAGQTLSALGFHLHALGGDKETAAEIAGYLEQVIENVRVACNQLQSNVVERSGLSIALALLFERLRNETGLEVHLDFDGKQRIPAQIGHSVYRIIELALDNVAKHSGANAAAVRVAMTGTGLEAEVADRGRGFNPKKTRLHPPGTGLILMESYAGIANLHLRIDSTRRRGTIIKIQTI